MNIMTLNINNLKNKIIYRASYRGTKEMDILLSAFVREIINDLSLKDLNDLSDLLEIDDENLYKWSINIKTSCFIKNNKVSLMLKNFNISKK
jgi:antitoxin CptB|tara:strand:- start:38 stop:313 length:276 start_codon:yes stop_codon:yes gene_type:complete